MGNVKNRNRNRNRKQRNKNKNNALTTVVSNTNSKSTTEKKDTTVSSTTAGTYTSYYTSKKKNYDYMGTKNQSSYPKFVNLCTLGQNDLKVLLEIRLKAAGYTEIISGDGYVYAKGTTPVLLTAHMDTVHKKLIEDVYEYYDEEKNQHILSSPEGIGGDDRCGIYMILEIIKTHKCSVLFCEDEESGGIGSKKFCKTEFIKDLSDLKYLIELDRTNGTDAVFYDCENDDFTKFITENTGYEESYGSFSDISHLSPACGVASVNLSCGYYNAHTTSEYVIMEEMFNTIEVVKKLLDVECEQFEYIEKTYNFGYYGRYGYGGYDYDYGYDYYGNKKSHNYGSGYYSGIYDDDDYYYDNYYNSKAKSKTKGTSYTPKTEYTLPFDDTEDAECTMLIYVYHEASESMLYYASNGKTTYESFGKFFINNPMYCYDDVYDYEVYEERYLEDGWYTM